MAAIYGRKGPALTRSIITPVPLPDVPMFYSPAGWYDAGRIQLGLLASWTDISNNGRHLLQATGANKPTNTANILGTHPAVVFAAAHFMKAVFTWNQPETIIAVFKATAYSGGVSDIFSDGNTLASAVVGSFDGTNSSLNAGAVLTTGNTIGKAVWSIMTMRFNGVNSFIRKDGTTLVTGNAGATNAGALTLNGLANGARGLNMSVAELILYSTAITTQSIVEIEQYLKLKYGL